MKTAIELRAIARRMVSVVAPVGSRQRTAMSRARVWLWRRFTPALTDPFDPAALAAFVRRVGIAFPLTSTEPITAETAAQRLLALLVTRPDLRERFPDAFRGGVAFADWVRDEATEFTTEERAHLLAVLERRPWLRALHWYDHDHRLPAAFPLALTPAGANEFMAWALRWRTGGRAGVGPNEALWFLFERATDPTCGLAATYRRNPEWQERVPDGLSPSGWLRLLEWVRTRYGVRGDWLDRAEPPAPEGPPAQPGVNVIGHFRYPSGLQVAATNLVAALGRVGYHVSARDVPANVDADLVGREEHLGLHPYPVTVSQLPPEPLAAEAYPRAGLHMRPDCYRIGYWYWEAEQVPGHWHRHARWLHELWAPTRFIGTVLRGGMPMPVVDMLAGMRMPPVVHLPRAHFGLPDNRFLFLFVFDMCSSAQRKNPFAVVEAYRRAFRPDEPVALAIKVSRGGHNPAALERLRAQCAAAGAHLIDATLAHDEVFGLMNCCDAYVSLHRSEGYGLTMAEAMALGKPVIATGYSGNLDFMTEENSLLVSHTRTRVVETDSVYQSGWTWAEPSVEHAAALMRRVAGSPDLARALGERARADVHRTLSLEAAGRRMAARLDELRAGAKRAA